MTLNPMTGLWARTGLVWFLLTMLFGMYLGLTGQFGFSSPHAHLGLLGWLSSAAFAFLYAATGAPARGARLHWAVHNVGVATMVTALFLTLKGVERAGLVIPLGGTIVILATLWLVAAMWPRLR
jgi:hypothetical protein